MCMLHEVVSGNTFIIISLAEILNVFTLSTIAHLHSTLLYKTLRNIVVDRVTK